MFQRHHLYQMAWCNLLNILVYSKLQFFLLWLLKILRDDPIYKDKIRRSKVRSLSMRGIKGNKRENLIAFLIVFSFFINWTLYCVLNKNTSYYKSTFTFNSKSYSWIFSSFLPSIAIHDNTLICSIYQDLLIEHLSTILALHRFFKSCSSFFHSR